MLELFIFIASQVSFDEDFRYEKYNNTFIYHRIIELLKLEKTSMII